MQYTFSLLVSGHLPAPIFQQDRIFVNRIDKVQIDDIAPVRHIKAWQGQSLPPILHILCTLQNSIYRMN